MKDIYLSPFYLAFKSYVKLRHFVTHLATKKEVVLYVSVKLEYHTWNPIQSQWWARLADFLFQYSRNVTADKIKSIIQKKIQQNIAMMGNIEYWIETVIVISHFFLFFHRVSIEWKSPYKESYTVNSCWKMFLWCVEWHWHMCEILK